MTKTNSFAEFGNKIDILIENSPYGEIKTFIGTDSYDIDDYGELCRLIIPPDITEIDDYEYAACDNLIEVIVMGGRVKLGEDPFGDNLERLVFLGEPDFEDDPYFKWQNLNEIVFPEDYEPDANALKAFESSPYFKNLAEFKIINGTLAEYTGSDKIVKAPDGVTRIGAGKPVFKKASGRKINRLLQAAQNKKPEADSIEVVLPESVEVIEDYAFYNTSVKRVNIPEKVYGIGKFAFAGSSLARIKLPRGLTYIGEGAFADSEIMRVEIPEGVEKIEENTFARCARLTRVTLPESVTSIGSRAFEDCVGLKELIIANKDAVIDEHAFSWIFMRQDKERPIIVRAPEGSAAQEYINNYKLKNVFQFKKLRERKA